MTGKQAPRRNLAPRFPSALAVLVLGVPTLPSLAATGTDALCDQPVDVPPMSLTDERRFAMHAIDQGTASTVASGTLSLEETIVKPDPAAAGEPSGPRVDVMLRRIFDEAQARQPKLSGPQESGVLTAPLAVDKTENAEEPAAVLDADPADPAAELPGFSADELLRYREQMYRTDI